MINTTKLKEVNVCNSWSEFKINASFRNWTS